MKIIKKIGIGFLLIIVSLLVIALFIPTDFKYEKSITINAPIKTVWKLTSSLGGMDMEEAIGKDFELGLNKLKTLAEK